MKLNLGCGNDYKDGWINIDCNQTLKTDMRMTLDERFPFEDNSVEAVYMCHSLEHIKDFWFFIDNIYRVCKDGAKIHIIVPHYSGGAAFYPQHYTYWSVAAWDTMNVNSKTLYRTNENYSKFKCSVDSIRLNWLSHQCKFYWIGWIFELLANSFGLLWMQFAERCPFGWFEVEYKLTVIKEK